MMLELLRGPRDLRDRVEVQVGLRPLLFELVRLRGGGVGLCATLAAADLEPARDLAAAMPRRYRLLREDQIDAPTPRGEALVVATRGAGAQPVSVPASATMIALHNGWTEDELRDAGLHNDPGPGGGYSAITGLTLGQMALSIPPEGWAAVRHRAYPWQVPGWQAPAGFTPPNPPAKAVDPTTGDAGRLALDPKVLGASPAATVAAADDLDAALTPDLPRLDLATLATPYPPGSWARAVEIVREALTGALPGDPQPSRAKIASRLTKAGLPPLAKGGVGDDQLRSLFDAARTT